MRIAYLVNQYPKLSHTFIRREIAALEARGLSVDRYTLRTSDEAMVEPADRAELARTRVVTHAGAPAALAALALAFMAGPLAFVSALGLAMRAGLQSHRGLLRHLAYFAEACILRRWLQTAGTTHLHVHFGTNSACVAMLCRLLGGPPYSLTVHGPEEFDMPQALSLSLKLRHAHFVIAISQFCRGQLLRWMDPADWGRVHVVRCGLDPAYLNLPESPPAGEPRLVCVGRLSAEKGQLLLLEAVRRLVARGRAIELELIGDGPLRGAIEAQIRTHGLARHVTLTGWADGATVRARMAQARAVVLPSLAEGLPVVIMEAFANWRPVVSTRIAAIPELIEHGRSGWVVAPGDVDGLCDALAEALDASPDQLAAMGRAGHAQVAARHDLAAEAALLAACFAGDGEVDGRRLTPRLAS